MVYIKGLGKGIESIGRVSSAQFDSSEDKLKVESEIKEVKMVARWLGRSPALHRAACSKRMATVPPGSFACGQESFSGRQRWVGRRVQPIDAAFNVLPWGFVPQRIVKEKLLPDAVERKESMAAGGLGMDGDLLLRMYGHSTQDIVEGTHLAWNFVCEQFNKGQPRFEEDLNDQIETNLGAAYDSQLRQLSCQRDTPLIELHQIQHVQVGAVFPLLLRDTMAPSEIENSRVLFNLFGVNKLSARMHFLKHIISALSAQWEDPDKDVGLRLGVEVIIKSSETAYFGPDKGIKNEDAVHILWFYGGGAGQPLMSGEGLAFQLANVNEALAMLQDVHDPDEWAVAPDNT